MTKTNMSKRKTQTGKQGGQFIWRVSKYTGRRYKQYLSRKTKIIRSPVKAAKGLVFVPWR